MNKAEFHILIEHPDNLGKSHVALLKRVIQDFPYFQAPQALLLKSLHNLNHYDFEKQLKTAAVTLPDREVLFRYINGIRSNPSPEKMPEPEPVAQVQPPVIESFIETIEKQTAPVIPVSEIQTDAESVETTLTTLPISDDTVIPTPIENKTEVTETPPLIEESVTDTSEPLPPNTLENSFLNTRHSFREWLSYASDTKTVSVPETTLTAVTLDGIELKPPPEEPVHEPVTIETGPPKKLPDSNINEFESILDKFIRENPRISRPKAEFYNPSNMARQSVEEDDDLVTETLAKLYHSQGHTKKAIRAYEKLSLLYPHRIAYFADLIQKIKNETKDS